MAPLTGKSAVVVYSPPVMQMIASTAATVNSTVRFHGFLFNNNGTLTMIAVVEGPGPGTEIDQH